MRYLEWLSSKVIPDVDKRVSYQKLLGALHETKFIWNVDNDGNRAFDGEKLRKVLKEKHITFAEAERSMQIGSGNFSNWASLNYMPKSMTMLMEVVLGVKLEDIQPDEKDEKIQWDD